MSTRPKRALVFGCNPVGREVANQLALRGVEVTLCDDLPVDEVRPGAHWGYRRVDITADDELRMVGIGGDVDYLFALFNEEASNVFLVLSARALASGMQIIGLSLSADSENKLLAAGASNVIDPYAISGRKIFRVIRRPDASQLLDHVIFGDANLKLAELHVPEGTPLEGRKLSELEIEERFNLMLLGIVDRGRGNQFFFATVGIDHAIDSDDVLVVIGSREAIEALRGFLSRGE